ncbi:F-box/LRR-repeat protein 17 isoform X1 [Triticum aestivum]|uniref:F-box/LRR-repeat protein 17 isoform X1 n=1 Tax=Triticum aestivum TaxID=4565 RepID=UPI001D026E6A|nr:F-box/LRR-repeat protein 17-like isoform X1 [Triticum aestivum]
MASSDALSVVPAPDAAAAPAQPAVAKKRGSYNCGRCGLPKKGHVCSIPGPPAAGAGAAPAAEHKPRRALHFDEAAAAGGALDATPVAVAYPAPHRPPEKKARVDVVDVDDSEPESGAVVRQGLVAVGSGVRVPGEVVIEVLRRLAPRAVAASAAVSRGWRDCARRVWRGAEELRLRAAGVSTIGTLLPRCPALSRLVLRMESDVDATMLACLAFSCPNMQSLEISMADSAVNRMTGDELTRFISEKKSLTVLKVDCCSGLGFLNINSTSLSTLWLSDLSSLTKSVINCPNLSELSLIFSQQDNDSTDLISMMDSLGRTCSNLRKLHISSIHLCNEAVFALGSANLRGLCMLSLLLGKKITDAAVASIVRSFTSLELLDLSGSCITDNGLGMVSKAFPDTLTRLLLAMCPNITSYGVQVATAQLPLLQLMDCGKSLCANVQPEAPRSYFGDLNGGIRFCSKLQITRKQQPTYQKLIIKHANLKKLSLWGCSGIDALCVNCPELNDLNLNSCINLNPERLLLQCPSLKDVHVTGCRDMLIGAIRNQVLNEFAAAEPRMPCKRLADGSKRVQVPQFMLEQQFEDEKWCGESRRSQCAVHI